MGQTACPQGWRDRWANTGCLGFSEQKPLQKPETWMGIDELPEAWCGQLWKLKTAGISSHRRAHNIVKIYLQELHQIPTINTEESPSTSSSWEGKEPFWNTPAHSVLPLRATSYPEPNPLGYCQSLADAEKGNTNSGPLWPSCDT